MNQSEANRAFGARWAQMKEELDSCIKQGQIAQAQQILKKQNPRQIPREQAAELGELAFRANSYLFTLKALHRFLYPRNRFSEPATNREKKIYATALLGLGAAPEAIKLFSSIDPEVEPEAVFYEACAHFHIWNYAVGIPILKRYVRSENLPPYRRLVGKINLSAAMIFEREWPSALALLNEVRAECEKNSHVLLLGNCFELMAQVYLFQKKYAESREFLALARDRLAASGGIWSLFVEKWIAVSELLQNPTIEGLKNLEKVKLRAAELNHWETIRECDLFQALAFRDESLAKSVAFGTPFEGYRRRVRNLFGENIVVRGAFEFYLGPSEQMPSAQKFDFRSKGIHGEALAENPQLAKTFDALTQDFYRPCSLGFLFSVIYPEEKFNSYSSPPRVIQSLRRLNEWFTKNQISLRIQFKKSEFRLISSSGVIIHLRRGLVEVENRVALDELKKSFQDRSFNSKSAAEILQVSVASAKRILKKAISDGELSVHGKGNNTRYSISSRKSRTLKIAS